MAKILIDFVVALMIVNAVTSESPKVPECQCENPVACHPVESWNKDDREVIMATEGAKEDYTTWMWESITSVLQLHDGYTFHNELMCYTHSKGRKYGFFIEVPEVYDVSSSDMNSFINEQLPTSIKMHNADLVALDLLSLLGNCGNTESHVDQILEVVTKVITETKKQFPKLKVLCVMPWKPPCYEHNCGVTPVLNKQCDAFIISPDSFTTYCSQSCRARATVPFTKLFSGLDDYEASGVAKDEMIIGIPWHGYNYTCETFTNNSKSAADSLCTLKTKKVNKTVCGEVKEVDTCDYKGSRQRIKLGDFYDKNPSLLMDTTTFSRSQQAPSITGKDAQNNTHMIWFEDYSSLSAKYSVVYHHNVKGCVVYTADDLSKSKIKTGKQFNSEMFAWLLHTILATSEHSYEKDTRNVAGLVAGVGIGMFVFGVLLGAIIACIRFRQKERLRPPFRKDFHKEYHDDDDQDL